MTRTAVASGRWLLIFAISTLLVPLEARRQVDTDRDGVVDEVDCAPNDPRIATPHTYYWDSDGDQSGNPAAPLSLCAVQPFNGTVLWPDDPADDDNRVTAASKPRGRRVLALDFAAPAEGAPWSADLARELGVDAGAFQLRWSGVNPDGSDMSGAEAAQLVWVERALSDEGFAVTLGIHPIVGTHLTVPADLAGGLTSGALRFDDPAVIARFVQVLDHVKASLGDTRVVGLQIGYEVDRFLQTRGDIEFWSAYVGFFQAVQAHAKIQWGPSLAVGMTATQAGLVTEPAASLMRALNGAADTVAVSYLPGVNGPMIDPAQVRADIEQVIARYYPTPVSLVVTGYPSAPSTGSSETRQAQFVGALFKVWDAYDELMPLVSFSRLFDTEDANVAIASAGLRTRVSTGAAKSSYHTFRTLALNRGWWRSELDTRPYLLGFTAAPYDHDPGTMPSQVVVDETSVAVGQHGDLIAYHFDNGVPWIEAFADAFAGPELPYSPHVRDTWSKLRAARPDGVKVAVAINPLGVPRNTLAPYWGVGEGSYHASNFELVGTGVVGDYQNRLLPPPWDSYALNAPQVKTAFLNYAKRTLDFFQPDYLITGIEVNLALQGDPELFAAYVELQEYVYSALRADPAYAHVKIVVSLAAEYFVSDEFGVPILADALQDPEVPARHLLALEALLPFTDVIGLSVYPIKARFAASYVPANFFDSLLASIRSVSDKPVAITEAGYPAASFSVQNLHFAGTAEKQKQFLQLLFADGAKHQFEFITNYAVRDQSRYLDKLRTRSLEDPPFIAPQLVEFYKYFEFIGIFDGDGSARPAADLFAAALTLPLHDATVFVAPVTLASPGGHIRATIEADPAGRLTYSVTHNGLAALEHSPLGITVDGVDLGLQIIDIDVTSVTTFDQTYDTRGAHRTARDHGREYRITMQRGGSGDRSLTMIWRLYDEGVGFRYIVPEGGERTITGEASSWTIPEGSPVWHQLSTSNYEGTYFKFPIGHFDTDVGAPLTTELSTGAGFLTLTEGALRNYSGMTYDADLGSRVIKAQFLDDDAWTVPGNTPTPWRLAIISTTLDGLVNSDLVTHVNNPPDPALFPAGIRTGWIRPGRAVWSWWIDNESGADWNLQRQYVDYATELRAEYVTVDAWWETGFPTGNADQFDRLKHLVDYAHTQQRFVGVWVWRSWFSLLDRTERRAFFARVRDAGAVGVKVDNLFDTRTESFANVLVYEEMLRDAAEFQLMLNFHGLHKPTGLERTYPNLMGHESIAGLEYTSIQWPVGGTIPVAHNATMPFVRYVAGSADYTPFTLDPRKIGESTFAHQLATVGIFASPILHFAEDPAILLQHQAIQDVIRTMPVVWDETIVLPESRIGELAALARRSGDRWYLFIINGDATHERSLPSLPLDFLGDRRYDATLIGDGTKTSFDRRAIPGVTSDSTIDVALLPGGGFAAMFLPAADPARPVKQGFSSIPPANTGPGWQDGYSWIRDHGNLISHSLQEGIPWPEALLTSDYRAYSPHLRAFWDVMRAADDAVVPNHARYLMINPIETVSYARLAPYHGERDYMPLPAPWDSYDFNHPHVKTAMVNYLIAAIDFFQPQYVATSIEANILLAKAPEKWGAFKELNAHLYTTLKKRYPHIKFFTTLHYEHMLGLAEESRNLALAVRSFYPNVLEAETRDLMRYSDLVAVSTYPYMMENNRFINAEGRMDFDYFDRAVAIARDLGKPLAFEQTGYISENLYVAERNVTLPGSEVQQRDYLDLVLNVAHLENAEFVTNFVVGDYGTNYGTFPSVLTWANTGLFRLDGTPKPALATWDFYRAETTGGATNPPPGTGEPPATGFTALAAAMHLSAATGSIGAPWSAETPPSPELFIRWQQFASFLPAFVVPPAEDPTAPWALGEPYRTAATTTIERRTMFMSYLQPLFESFSATGAFALLALSGDDELPLFLLGDWVLMAPVVEEGAFTRTVALPAGSAWRDWYTGQLHPGGTTIVVDAPLERIPLFVRSLAP